MNRKINPTRVDEYVDIVSSMSKIKFDTKKDFEKYYNERNWKLRLNGRDLSIGESRVVEIQNAGKLEFLITKQNFKLALMLKIFNLMYHLIII